MNLHKLKKTFFPALFFSLIGFNGISQKTKDFHSWAATPPMGWNSWDCFGPTVTEAEVKANADYMAQYLKPYGWDYIVVDIRWYVGNDKAHGYNEKDPDYVIDQYGRFMPAVNRFPSAAGGKGFKPLADYLHSKGLKFGIHIMRGIPVIAVKQNIPIKGTNLTARDIYSDKDQCSWLHDMYTIVPGKPGAQEYYNSLFEMYASWGLDFVKIDDLSSPIYFEGEIDMIRKAINRTGRKIVLSTSPGETPIAHADHVQKNANMWRTVGDFWDSWGQLKDHFEVFERWNKWRAYGAYPDGDMLPLGHIGIRAERGDPRMTAFTKEEQYTLMTLWSIFKSPLMFGGNLPDNDPFTLSLLTNKNVLKVLNESTNNKPLFTDKNKAAWIADEPKTGAKYLAVFNTADQKLITEEKAIWNSGLIAKNSSTKSVTLEIDIRGAKKLYLVVTDGGDKTDWDHADWIEPTLYNEKGATKLTDLKWVKATSGWQKVKINQSISGNTLTVNGIKYDNGIGVHANSIIEYDLPEGYTRFKTTVGLDEACIGQNTGATVKFLVFTENPSGPLPPANEKIAVDLKSIGFPDKCVITDLWSGKEVGEFSGEFAPVINRHGAGLYKIVKVSK
ncbi:NPCBM/NEW2 domain-containing protein [Flavobacterium gilvum]|uniref:Alpha-galactosidase n=1 Tax=Flavobacterium gilvum TaxID=1492737 RepID=A0AAC9N4J2_9FLAO|nr:NPCBM/NEW2 domain-containing protein [Flavobacterium gilvum]AOW10810.1 alpha-galactosidase [Flavobacterium gilvum]KFC59965.1 Melibiase subfamily [Flavobacterium gilvum]